jgi:hypothetical protein
VGCASLSQLAARASSGNCAVGNGAKFACLGTCDEASSSVAPVVVELRCSVGTPDDFCISFATSLSFARSAVAGNPARQDVWPTLAPNGQWHR